MPLEVWPLKNRGLSLLISSSKLSLYRHYALFRTKELSCAYMWAVRILEDWGHSSFIKWHWYFLLLLWHHNHVLQFPLWLGGEVWGGHVHLPCVWCGSETCPWVPQGVSTICNKPDVSGANLPAVTVSFLIFCTFPPPPPYFLTASWIFTLSNDGECCRYRLLASAHYAPRRTGRNLLQFNGIWDSRTELHSIALEREWIINIRFCCRLFSLSTLYWREQKRLSWIMVFSLWFSDY